MSEKLTNDEIIDKAKAEGLSLEMLLPIAVDLPAVEELFKKRAIMAHIGMTEIDAFDTLAYFVLRYIGRLEAVNTEQPDAHS